MTKHRQRKAFTIVEMVIVIAVIAILATVMIPTVAGVIQRANISADTQFAASLNIQLAMYSVDHEIENESDLRDAINYYYGNAENPDYYASFTPKSGKYGYHYWYDVANKQVVLKTVADLIGDGTMPTAMLTGGFATDSLRSGLIEGYFFMDHSDVEDGNVGENIADLISAFENLPDPGVYEQLITETLPALLESEKYGAVAANIENRLKVTTIITDGGAFRYEANNAEDIRYVWVPITATKLQQTKVYVYDGSVVDDGQNSDKFAGTAVEGIHFPAGVTSGLGGIPAICVDTYTDDVLVRNYENTTKLYVQTNDIAELEKIFTDCVIVTPNGSRYIFVGDKLYSLPITIDAATKQPVGNGVGSVNNEIMSGIDAIGIECLEASTSVKGEDKVYLYNGTLYVAYDKGSVKLSLTDGVTNGMVTWSSANTDLATVDATGTVTLKLPQVTQGAVYSVDITATYKYDTSVSATVKVFIARPTSVSLKVGAAGVELYNDTDKGAINISYEGNNASNAIVLEGVESNAAEFVKLDAGVLAYETSGTLFTVADNKLVINTAVLNGTSSQDLTIIYKNANGTEYLRRTYTVTIEDNSTVGLKKNQITSTVAMGEKYLFRVGNGNAFKLSSLFSALEESKDVAIKSVKIYNAADTDNDGNRSELATSGTGFHATYTANSNWKEATIQFGGTGVAIIEVNTAKGKIELNVEVVEGYNITSASQLQTNKNNVLLNDIVLTDYGTSIGFTGNANNHVVFYGNGFKFDITGGRTNNVSVISLNNADLDNVRIIGAIYTQYESTYNSGNNPYYSSAVYITGGSSTISNCYIYGTRANVSIHGDGHLDLVNTVLDCARLANLDIRSGTVSLDGVTTINVPRADNSNVAGLAIAIAEEAEPKDAPIAITITGKGLTQYNWLSSGDKSKLPSITGLSSLFDTMMSNSAYAEYRFTVGGNTYLNMGIISLSSKVGDVVIDATNTAPYAGEAITVSGHTGYFKSIVKNKYTLTDADLAYRTAAYQWEPSAQNPSLPKFTWSSGFEDRKHELSFAEGGSVEFDPSKLLSAKKFGNALAVSVAFDNGTYTGSFNEPGTYTFIYTVTDSYVYNLDGSLGASKTYTFKLTVEVTELITSIKDPEFKYTNGTGFKVVESGGKQWITPVFDSSNSSKFKLISGSGDTAIYAPISTVEFKNNTSDYYVYYNIFDMINIVNYTEKGANATGTTYSSSYSGSDLPSGLTWESGGWNNSKGWTGYTKFNSQFARQTGKIGSNATAKTENVTYKFVAGNGETYYYYVSYKIEAHTCPSGCVTPDTLVTLADGTQKQIQNLVVGEEVLAWNFITGEYEFSPVISLQVHITGYQDVLQLYFEDGTELKLIEEHGLFDMDLNTFVFIDQYDVEDYIGHYFFKQDGENFKAVKLESYDVVNTETKAYALLTYNHLNVIHNDMLTILPAVVGDNFYTPFEINEDMKYDDEQMKSDIEKYGLYTYEDFADYVTYEQFVALNLAQFKVSVGKGLIDFEGLVVHLEEYVNNKAFDVNN